MQAPPLQRQRETAPADARLREAAAGRAPEGAWQRRADGAPSVRRTAQLRDALDRRAASASGGVAQRVLDLNAVRELGAGRSADLLSSALEHSQGAARQLFDLARGSDRFDLVFETFEGKPMGRTELRYRDDDTRIDLEEAQRPDPVRARAGGLVMRIGVNPKALATQGALLQTLTHEIGVHAAAFAPHLQALLHGGDGGQAADRLAYELEDPGLLSGSVQHLLLAGGEAADYEELSRLLAPRLAELGDDFRAADLRDRTQEQQLSGVTFLRVAASDRELPFSLARALTNLGLLQDEDEDTDLPSTSTLPLTTGPVATTSQPLGVDLSALFNLAAAVTTVAPPAPAFLEPAPWVNPFPVPSNIELPPLGREQEPGPLPSLRDLGLDQL